ncbi:MAG: protein-disulfide reductase DsbD family protein [Spongiibacteraceae bacterium]
MKRLFLCLLTLLASCMNVQAVTDRAATEQVAAQLIASVDSVYPGEKIWIGLQQKIIPHWHTYWINPGDSGLPTKITWQLPPGATAGAIEWPAPTRFDLEGITNYGYSDEVVLLTQIALPSTLAVGKASEIAAKVDWLVCADVCIPQTVDLSINLPVIAANASHQRTFNPTIESAIAALPQQSAWKIHTVTHEQLLQLRIEGAAKKLSDLRDVNFFADTWGRVEHTAPQLFRIEGDDLVVELKAGDKKLAAGESLSGVLKTTSASGDVQSFIIGTPSVVAATTDAATVPPLQETQLGLWAAALFALLGGLVLNLMPCVFPVLSIKALALIKHSESTVLQNRLHGLAYTSGVLASFLVLAALLIALKAGGSQLGWGFQYQSPLFVVAVAYLLFAVGLNLSGVFEFGTSITGVGSSLANKSGYTGSFFTGVLAAIVATPCTAPFMGAAIGFALSQPPLPLIAIFLSLGLGLALPYLLLAFWPQLQRRLPKPGHWMELLKQALAFPMYAAAVWLIWVLAQQTSADAVAFALGGLVLIAFAAWIFQQSRNANGAWRAFGFVSPLIAVFAAITGGYSGISSSASNADANNSLVTTAHSSDAIPYSAQRLAELRSEGRPIFVNFTAAWCISCLVNERVALKQRSVTEAFVQQGIVYLKGDWTNRDTEISTKLAEFGRSGVPLYLYFPPQTNSEPIVLPQVLTPDIVLSAIKEANQVVLASNTGSTSATQNR